MSLHRFAKMTQMVNVTRRSGAAKTSITLTTRRAKWSKRLWSGQRGHRNTDIVKVSTAYPRWVVMNDRGTIVK